MVYLGHIMIWRAFGLQASRNFVPYGTGVHARSRAGGGEVPKRLWRELCGQQQLCIAGADRGLTKGIREGKKLVVTVTERLDCLIGA